MIVALQAELSFSRSLSWGRNEEESYGTAGMEVNLKFAGRIKDGVEFPPSLPPFPFRRAQQLILIRRRKGYFLIRPGFTLKTM